jgi:DNA-binding MarR family transcriptional regulator
MNVEETSLAALRRITRATDVYSRALVREHQLTGPQLSILTEVARHGEAPIGALAKATYLGAPTVTGIVDRLERQALVSRIRAAADRRQVLIALTAAGKRVLARDPSPLHAGFRDQLLELPKAEQRQICEALERVALMMEQAASTARQRSSSRA